MRFLAKLLGLSTPAFVLKFAFVTNDPAGNYWDVSTNPSNQAVEMKAKDHTFDFTVTDPTQEATFTITIEPGHVWGFNAKTKVDNVTVPTEVQRELTELAEQACKDLSFLDEHVARALDDDELDANAGHAAVFFAKNPELLANADKYIVVEFVPTYLCTTGCGEDHVREDYRSPNAEPQNPLIAVLSISGDRPEGLMELLESGPPELKRLLGNRSPKNTVIELKDRDGKIAASPYAAAISQGVISMMIPRVKQAIPEVITRRESDLEDALRQVSGFIMDMQLKREALAAAGINLPEMSTSLASFLPSDASTTHKSRTNGAQAVAEA